MKQKEVIIIGLIRLGRVPDDGETTKNQFIIKEISKYAKVIPLDFYERRKHPFIYVRTFFAFLFHPKASIIFSTTAKNVYSFIKLFKKIRLKRNFVHWVIGGSFDKLVKEGEFDIDVLNYLNYNLVQCHSMVDSLRECGLTNVKFVQNFKDIPYYPNISEIRSKLNSERKIKFVFLSRIMKKKGVDYLLNAVRILNEHGLADKFCVDLYGKMDENYRKEYEAESCGLENVLYHGLINLRSREGYDTLAAHHAMLFPTYHPSEGIAGVIIDAYIAGVPVITTDWGHNREIIDDGVTGIIIPTCNLDALVRSMQDVIDAKIDLDLFSKNCQAKARLFDAPNVLTREYLEDINLV